MSVVMPTTEEIKDANLVKFETNLNQTTPLQTKAFLKVLAAVEAMGSTMLYKFAQERILQNLGLTATGEDLETIGSAYGVNKKTAIKWDGIMITYASNGTSFAVGTQYVGDLNGKTYISYEVAIASGGVALVKTKALEGGTDYNLNPGDSATIATIVPGLTITTALVHTPLITIGVDKEEEEAYRRRVLNEIRTVGGGGNSVDYRTWSEEVEGVFRAFPYAGSPILALPDFADSDMEKTGVTDWGVGNSATITKNTGSPHSGVRNLRVARNGVDNPYADQDPLVTGERYRLRGWVKSDGNALPQIRNMTSTLWVGTNSTSWNSFDVTFDAIGSKLKLRSVTSTGTEYCEFDDFILNQVPLPGDRTVYVEVDSSLDPDGLASSAILGEVRTSITTDPITLKARQPLGMIDDTLFVESITRTTIYLETVNLDVPVDIEAETRTRIEDTLDEYLRAMFPYNEGLDALIEKNDVITGVQLSIAIQVIVADVGGSIDEVNFGIVPATFTTSKYTLSPGETVKSGGVTYA